MTPARRRILFIAEAVTLAHVARPLSLARTLDLSRYEVVFACDGRFDRLLDMPGFTRLPLESISSSQFLEALARGSRLYSRATLDAYVQSDLELIRTCRPDVIVGDFRLSLSVSARLAGTPYVTVSNAYWSPYARPRFTVPELPMLRVTGERLGQRLFDVVRPWAFRYHALPLNQLRRQYGLPALGLDLRRVYTDADYTLYADIPQLVPTFGLPETHAYVGPTLWSPAGALPAWWDTLPDDKPVVYVTLGSSGHAGMLRTVLKELAGLPVTVVAASAGKEVPVGIPANAHVADFLPGEEAARRAAMVISNGGSQTSYQALAQGKPVIGIPSNLDQYLNMHYVEATGAGRMIRTGSVAGSIADAVRDMLGNARYAAEADRLRQAIADYPSRPAFEAVLARAAGAAEGSGGA